MPKIVTPRC